MMKRGHKEAHFVQIDPMTVAWVAHWHTMFVGDRGFAFAFVVMIELAFSHIHTFLCI